jgi:predicted Zn-dependent protease with MMP-like domain
VSSVALLRLADFAALHTPHVLEVTPERFEELVGDGLDALPDEIARLMDNVAVVVEDGRRLDVMGLYEGVPLTQRDDSYGLMAMPDRITIFRRAILAACRTEDEVVAEVRITVIHEVGHHFGIDDERLDQLGWG